MIRLLTIFIPISMALRLIPVGVAQEPTSNDFSIYLSKHDGVQITVDVFLPTKAESETVPTLHIKLPVKQ
jgi:hypothetical protein